jgi:hypothetical protein
MTCMLTLGRSAWQSCSVLDILVLIILYLSHREVNLFACSLFIYLFIIFAVECLRYTG